MSTDLEPSGKPEKRPLIKSRFPSLADFLTKQPPGSEADVSCHLEPTARAINFLIPDLWLDCENANCDGFRWFDGSVRETSIGSLHRMDVFLKYTCRNCKQTSKTYAISIGDQAENLMTVRKIGEWPPFGPRTPSRVITLIGPDRDLFLKGRRAEIQGLGIGAFAYYRRVIENQKNRLLEKIIEVAKRASAPGDMVQQLDAAKTETQFTKAIDSVRNAIPESLKIKGHNPLTLLHSALSEGLHDSTDASCLELATAIREVLFELAERIDAALKDHAELNAAVSRLLAPRSGS